MSNLNIPFNIFLLQLNDETLKNVRPTKSIDIFNGASRDFHDEGLFSVVTFGKVGDERRNRAFSYIDIKISIFHPVVHKALVKLKGLYAEIMSSKAYAVWDEELQDFVKSDPFTGSTGYSFFIRHWKKIKFEEREQFSTARYQNIQIVKKFQDIAMTSKIVVIPAGLRDIEIGADGRVSENEINDLYKKLLSVSQGIAKEAITNNPEILDGVRNSLQNTFINIYELIESLIEGKKKLMMGKWASRKVFNGTRNVISSAPIDIPVLGGGGSIGFNDTVIGLYQFMKGTLPITIYNLKQSVLSKVFIGPNQPAILINKKTLKKEMVNLSPEYFDAYMTNEGLEKIITSFSETTIRHKPLEIQGYYVSLIYKGKNGTYRLMQDIDELPDSFSKDDVYPLTFCELMYLSNYKNSRKYVAFITRFPITGEGSIYPSFCYVKTTNDSEVRAELDEYWQPTGEDNVAYQFPVTGSTFFNSLSPSPAHLGRLAADFDGDTSSANIVYSEEAIAEANAFITSKKYYRGTNGQLTYSVNTDTTKFVLHNMSGPAEIEA